MDFKKVLDQTVREIKREVNKKVLKVPEIEQKVLDATSNEPWGPHGTAMAEIAHATRNYYEYQMIMTVIWKRISDTGRNWRHVYKALTLLEYLVSHGSERVIDEIKENNYKISTLSDFQYLEPNGKDQGINVRKKSQTLLALVNDKEKIKEVRHKAIENRDKYRGVSSTGAMHKSSSYSGGYSSDRYDDDGYGSGSRYGSRDDDKNTKDKDSDYDDDWHNARREDDKYKGYDKEFDHEHSTRGSGDRDDEYQLDDWKSSQKHQTKMPPPPSYEEAHTSPDYQRADDSRGGGNAPNKTFDDDDDDFDPRAAPKPVPPQPASLLATDDLFGSAEFVGSTATMPSQPNNFDFFGESTSSAFTSIPAATNLQEPSSDLFGNSPFKVETPAVTSNSVIPPPPNYSGQMTKSAIPPPPKFTGPNMNSGTAPSVATANSFNNFDAFASVPQQPTQTNFTAPVSGNATSNTLGGNVFDAFISTPSNVNPSSAAGGLGAFDAFSTNSPPVSQTTSFQSGGDDFFGANAFNSSATSVSLLSSQPNPAGGQGSSSVLSTGQGQNNTFSKAETEKKFETKSSVWADGLSKGLIDLNISGPKTNSLGEIGIDFDLLRTDKKKDDRTTNNRMPVAGMGKAMGSGSGLGVAGAGAIARPPLPANPMMGMNAMGINPMMGMANPMGMGPSMGATPMMHMGMNSGMAMRPGTSPTIGTGMNPGMGMGGYQNQQQQYNGFM